MFKVLVKYTLKHCPEKWRKGNRKKRQNVLYFSLGPLPASHFTHLLILIRLVLTSFVLRSLLVFIWRLHNRGLIQSQNSMERKKENVNN